MWLKSWITKKSKSTFVNYHTIKNPVWSPTDYASLAYEGYQKNIIVYRSITLIARSLASVPWCLYKKGDEIDEHPILNLLKKPNPLQSGARFIETFISHLLISGNAYIQALKTKWNEEPVELYCLRPDRMKIIPRNENFPLFYEYTVNGQPKNISIESLLHIKFFHPLNDWYGLSPLEAASKSIDQHNTVSGHNLALMQNGGRPSGALFVKNYLSDDQRSQLRESLEENYQSLRNAGKMMILEGDFDWKEMGLSPKDLDFIDGKGLSAREIAQAFGVPPMLVGVPGDATFSNFREARYHLWEDTIIPLLEMVINEFNIWLTTCYGPDLTLRSNLDGIPALTTRQETRWAMVNTCEFLTINEKREAVGYSPLPEGDVLQ